MLNLVHANGSATSDAGASLFGADLSTHPAWWLDAVRVVANTRARYEIAEAKAGA
jgi:hypothetical protein